MSCPSNGVVRIICSNHWFSSILFMDKNRRGPGRLSTMRHLSSPPRSRPPFSQIHSSMAQRVTFLIVGLGSARTSDGTFRSSHLDNIFFFGFLICKF
ncbi:hypothetical protein BpHYR1_034477 [Brachionus plicatilis]|uniref:Uncharacterized protein n=1 Tax=Brachionus plicatilis TaxID=10195 RepID=A0A3M7R115_BRAPC|nr:hypothetical protein BpHYR1_034477 [Brachionus plicatilis]